MHGASAKCVDEYVATVGRLIEGHSSRGPGPVWQRLKDRNGTMTGK